MRTHLDVGAVIPAEPAAAWELLTDTRTWASWGPMISDVSLDDPAGDPAISPGATGTVRTVVGPTLAFRVEEFEPERRWTWRVAGVPATGHRVEAHPEGCRVVFEVPMLAAPYAAVCRLALHRIARILAPGRRRG